VIPPNVQGYHAICPYTLDPSPEGAWTAPDLDTAKQLVHASGTEGMHITLAYPPFWPEEGGHYLTSVLQDLGYRVTLTKGGKDYFGFISDSTTDVQVGGSQWGADYPAASQFINVLLSCGAFVPHHLGNLNASQFCDRDIDAQISQALELQVTDQSASSTLWAEIDRALVDAAAIVPLFNKQGIDILSDRVGDYQHHPLYGLLISQLWVQ
jgi:peptide/nickel transport system substrate-binding protein